MLKMFLSASAFGSICFLFLSIVIPTRFEPVRAKFMSSKATTGMVPVVLGTFLLGCGMTVAGSCPGMVYIQLGAGVENAIITLLGGMAGAMSYGLVQPYLASFLAIGRCKQQKLDDLDMLAGVKYWQLAPALPAFLAIAIGLFEHYFPWDSPSELGAGGNATYAAWSQAWAPELSGVLIGSLQLPAVLVAGGTVGSSSTYMVVVAQVLATPSLQDHFKHLNGFRSGPSMWQSVLYIWSAALGAYIAASAGGTFASSRGVPPGPAFIGGFLMLFGSRFSLPPPLSHSPPPPISLQTCVPTHLVLSAWRACQHHAQFCQLCRQRAPESNNRTRNAPPSARSPVGRRLEMSRLEMSGGGRGRMAGGCTSGHGLSGMALLSLQSILGVPAMFAGGIATAFVYDAVAPAAFLLQ